MSCKTQREGGSAPKRVGTLRYCFPHHASVQWRPGDLTIHTNKWILGAGFLGAPPIYLKDYEHVMLVRVLGIALHVSNVYLHMMSMCTHAYDTFTKICSASYILVDTVKCHTCGVRCHVCRKSIVCVCACTPSRVSAML